MSCRRRDWWCLMPEPAEIESLRHRPHDEFGLYAVRKGLYRQDRGKAQDRFARDLDRMLRVWRHEGHDVVAMLTEWWFLHAPRSTDRDAPAPPA